MGGDMGIIHIVCEWYVFLNVGYYIFTDVSLNPSKTIYTGDFYNVGSDCFDGDMTRGRYSTRRVMVH